MKAFTRPLDHDIDLNAVARGDGYLFVRDGVGVAGRGVAARGPVAEIEQRLAAIECVDEVGVPGGGPIALGALPFRPDAPGELIVPRVVVGKAADGTRWISTIDDADEVLDAPPPRPTAVGFTLRPGFDPDAFRAAVARGRDAVRAGRLDKVVLARDVQM